MKKILVFVFLTAAIFASEKINTGEFAKIVLIDNGRTKPMDSFAQNFLLKVSGRSAFKSEKAVSWMARHVFNPASTADDPIFKINNEDVLQAMGLSLPQARRYSWRQLEAGKMGLYRLVQTAMGKEAAQQDIVEKEAIRLFINLGEYEALSTAFSFASTEKKFNIQSSKVREMLSLPADGPLSAADLTASGGAFKRAAITAEMKMGSKPGADDLELLMLSHQFESLRPSSQEEVLALLPDFRDGSENWYSAWTYISAGQDGYQSDKIINLTAAAAAFNSGSQSAFDDAIQKFNALSEAGVPEEFKSAKPSLEIFHNRLDPFYRAEMLYLLSFLGILFFLLTGRDKLRTISWGLLIAGIFLNSFGLFIRVILTQRPPVTNLYETFIFVAGVGAALAAVLEVYNKKGIGTLAASLTGLAMLLISRQFNNDGDTMGVMAAVLRSNFWLTTHVLTISIGYAGTIVAALVAHIYLIRALKNPLDHEGLAELTRMAYGAIAVGFIFTFVGTVLGGIWADQSWGRFWGWDPKENGALLIILWTSIILHARATKIIGPWGFAMGTAFGAVFVMLAWFGVNLLGVGLHSYGFTTGIAAGLFGYIALETVFLAFCHFRKPSSAVPEQV